nr:HU family DNA-binding protein [Belnapia sp. F-4-1]
MTNRRLAGEVLFDAESPKPVWHMQDDRRSALTKDDFVALVAEKGAMAKADAGRAVDAFCGAVTAAMQQGEDVKLPGFGSFEVQERGERQGRNVRTGEALTIAASKAVRFSAGSKLKNAVNGKES